MATSKIIKIEMNQKTYQGKTTMSYTFHLEDGIFGFVNEKVAPTFREGDMVDYSYIEKTSTKGPYKSLTVNKASGGTPQASSPQPAATPTLTPKPAPQAPVSPPSGKITEANIFGAQANGATTLMTTVLEAVLEGKVTNVVALEKYHEFQAVLEQTIDALAGKK
jgi:hypothetical protein